MSMQRFYKLKIKQTEYITPTVKKFTLISEEKELPLFGAGAHITIRLPMGTRQYSLINDPFGEENAYTIAVKNVGSENGASTYLHTHIREGDTLEVSAPDNYFPIRSEARHHVLFAAGIGITPFLSMMAHLTRIGHSFELHYAGARREECAFYTYLSDRYPAETNIYIMGREQKVQLLKKVLMDQTVGTHFYICGPSGFMDQFTSFTREIGYPEENIHSEKFRPAQIITKPEPFRATLSDSGQTIHVGADESLLQALRENGIPVPYACRMGVCGTCEVDVCNGEVQHNETFLTEVERKEKMLSCVSRGVGHITIRA